MSVRHVRLTHLANTFVRHLSLTRPTFFRYCPVNLETLICNHRNIILLNVLVPGGNKKVTYLKPLAAGFFKYVWIFCYHQVLKGKNKVNGLWVLEQGVD